MKIGIFITDANILIDLIKLDLLFPLLQSEVFEFKTTDFVLNELYEEQKKSLIPFILNNHLEVLESREQDLIEIAILKQQVSALSFEDCSVCYFAIKYQGVILTGDARLRTHAVSSGLKVHGILYLFDQMLQNKIVTPKTAIRKLRLLAESNKRLPQKEIEKRFQNWNR